MFGLYPKPNTTGISVSFTDSKLKTSIYSMFLFNKYTLLISSEDNKIVNPYFTLHNLPFFDLLMVTDCSLLCSSLLVSIHFMLITAFGE